jgi:hypothetical protein
MRQAGAQLAQTGTGQHDDADRDADTCELGKPSAKTPGAQLIRQWLNRGAHDTSGSWAGRG